MDEHQIGKRLDHIVETQHKILDALFGNGRQGVLTRLALLEQQGGFVRYALSALVGAGIAVAVGLVLTGNG